MNLRQRAAILISLPALLLCSGALAQNTNVKCPDTVKINSYLTVYNFTYSDIDTVKVRLYAKGSRFKKPYDSFFVYSRNDIVNKAENNKRFINIGGARPITNMEDWEVILGSGKYIFKISDVKTTMQVLRHSLYKCQLWSYKINGVKHQGSQISLSKDRAGKAHG